MSLKYKWCVLSKNNLKIIEINIIKEGFWTYWRMNKATRVLCAVGNRVSQEIVQLDIE